MKSIKYIIVAGLLGVFSCQKEDIKPNRAGHCNGEAFDDANRSALILESSSLENKFVVGDRIATGADNASTGDGGVSTGSGTISTGDVINTGGIGNTDTGGGITDPNNEPDASKRKGKK